MATWIRPETARRWQSEDFNLDADGIIADAVSGARDAFGRAAGSVAEAARPLTSFSIPSLSTLTAGLVPEPAAPPTVAAAAPAPAATPARDDWATPPAAPSPTSTAPPRTSFSIPSLETLTAGLVPPTPAAPPAPLTPSGAASRPPPTAGAAPSDFNAYVRSAAARRGLDPEQVAAVMGKEGPSGWGAVGRFDTGTSYGPLQLHYAGGSNPQRGMGDDFTRDTGIDLRTDTSLRAHQAAVDYALDRLSKTGDFREWYGADPALGSRFTKVNRITPTDLGSAVGSAVSSAAGAVKGVANAAYGAVTGAATAAADRATAGAYAAGDLTPNQYQMATSEGLDAETAWAVCGPAAAIAFARRTGRNPTMREAVDLAKGVGWTAAAGMAGPASQQKLLSRMGIAASLEEGAPNWQKVIADVQRGNPVTISTPGHYFVAERYDPETGMFDFGQSAKVLKASGGKSWFRPDQLGSLGMGDARAALYLDNPDSPSASVAAGRAPQAPSGPGIELQSLSLRGPLATQPAELTPAEAPSTAAPSAGPTASPWNVIPSITLPSVSDATRAAGDAVSSTLSSLGSLAEGVGQGISSGVETVRSSLPDIPLLPSPVDTSRFAQPTREQAGLPAIAPTEPLERIGSAIAAAPGRFYEDRVAPIVGALAPRTGLAEGLTGLAERTFKPAPPRSGADAAFMQSARDVTEPIFRPIEQGISSATSALEDVLGAPPGTIRQAAEDVSNVLGPAGAMVGGLRFGADDAARAARGAARQPPAQQAIRMTPEQEVGRLRLDKFPTELRPAIQQAAESTGYAHDARRGVIPDAAAEQMADDVTRSVDDWIAKSKVGQALNTEETRALRNLVTGQAATVDDLARQIAEAEAGGVVTDVLLVRAHQEAEKLASLVSVMEGARAEAGRGLRAWAAQTRPTDPKAAAEQLFNKFGGGPEARQRALDALKEFQQIPADDPIAQANFWARVERGGTIRASDILTAIRYNSMLSSPRTWEIGWIGSLLQAPLKIGNDLLAAVARPGSGEIGQAALGSFIGLKRGIRPMLETIQHGITTEQALAGQLPRGLAARATTPAGRALGTFIDLPGRMVAAPDALFTSVFRQAELGRQAAIQAYQQGLTGDDQARFIRDFLANPPEAIGTQVDQSVDRLMLRSDLGPVGQFMESIGRNTPHGDLIKSFVLPFMKVSQNVWSQGVELTPLGALNTAVDAALAPLGHGPYAKGIGAAEAATNVRPLAERLRYNAMGLGITGWATMQALEGNVSGNGPDDVEKRKMLQGTGWQPYSVKIGDTWVSYANWGPVAVPLALAAAYAESGQYAKTGATAEQRLADMAARTGKLVTEQTFLKGIGDLIKAVDEPDRYGPQVIANMATSFVPWGAGLNTVGQALDPVRRQPEKAKDVGFSQYILQSVASRLPFVRTLVPEARDVLGRPDANEMTGLAAFQPLRISQQQQDATLQTFLDAKVDIGAPKAELTVSRTPIALTPEEQRRWSELRGGLLAQHTPTVRDTPGYQAADHLGRQTALQKMLALAAEAADRQLMAEIGGPELTRRVEEAAARRRAG